MPLVIEGGRVPRQLSQRNLASPEDPASCRNIERIRIALINNMPDAALEDTEIQFFDLLGASAGDVALSLKLYSLPHLPRGDAGVQHLRSFYLGIEDLLNNRFDGVIMTGTEPRYPDLRQEPYWAELTKILDWAERNTTSTVLSCLAAHAGVLHSDGIPRHRLPDKHFGVFEYKRTGAHALTGGVEDKLQIPHSRWNEVRGDALISSGYAVLTQCADAGVDLFVKKKKNSLFVHFQGHPEYAVRTLLKEYRRDVKRFLRGERETYPNLPHGYFDRAATQLLEEFHEHAVTNPGAAALERFPEAAVSGALQRTWRKPAIAIYRNWLQYLRSRRTEASPRSALVPATRG